MLLLSIWLIIVGLFETSAAFYSLTGSRDVFHVHPTPQTRAPRDSTVLNRSKFFPLFRQLWRNSRFGVVSTNESGSDLGYAIVHVCWEDNESCDLETCQAATRKGGSPEDERLDELSNVVTNSGGAVIGGSCTGGFFVLCVVIYILYRLLKDDRDPRTHPAIVHVSPAQDVTNQNGASCPHCRNVPRSPPPAYNEVFPMEECACCTSTPPANTNWPNK